MNVRTLRLLSAALIACMAMQPARADLSGADLQLVQALHSDDLATAQAAMAGGADVNADLGGGRTLLIAAVMASRLEAVRMLLANGADPSRHADDPAIGNAVTAAFSAANGAQLTGRAGAQNRTQRANALAVLRLVAEAKQGLNVLVHRGPNDMTALMLAAEAGALDAVRALLDAGADPNTKNSGGYTALDYAVDRAPRWSRASGEERRLVVRELLAIGAKVDHAAADGATPVIRAQRSGNTVLVELLAARTRTQG